MGFFFRKSFRLGPVRLNLSKSGLGISGGVKGARLGLSARGAYIAGGLKGIYFRKRIGSPGGDSGAAPELSAAAVIVIWLAMLTIGAILVAAVVFVLWIVLRT